MRLSGRRRFQLGPGLGLLLAACGSGGGFSMEDAAGPAGGSDADVQSANVGATCDILTDAGPAQGVYNAEALECSSRMCMKPVVQMGASGPSNTTAFCTAPCTQDSDCAGETREPANPIDTRCQTGFVCGIPFVKGKLCCLSLCLCKDFLGSAGAPIPIACQGDAAASCNQ